MTHQPSTPTSYTGGGTGGLALDWTQLGTWMLLSVIIVLLLIVIFYLRKKGQSSNLDKL